MGLYHDLCVTVESTCILATVKLERHAKMHCYTAGGVLALARLRLRFHETSMNSIVKTIPNPAKLTAKYNAALYPLSKSLPLRLR